MGTLGTILSVVGGIGSLIFGIQLLILAFKKSVGWGLACFGVMAIGYTITGAAMFSGAMAGAGQ
ncbi:MAG: hypothetical protein R2862_05665 [Thermoanaerobaculia bacterium]